MTVGTIEDSRIKAGTLTLDGTHFAKQMTEIKFTPSVEEEGERVETASGAVIEADEVTAWVLELGNIQDFDDPAGFVEFARANAGTIVPAVWLPNAVGAPTISASVRVRAVEIGGAVATRLTSSNSWPVIGDIDPEYPAP